MGNHCMNALKLEGKEDTIQNVLEFIKGEEELIDFNKIIPIPLGLQTATSRMFEDDIPAAEYKAAAQRNIEQYGYEHSQLFCLDKWGTRLNSHNSSLSKDGKVIYFETMWTPPMLCIIKLSEIFPEVKFTAKHADEFLLYIGLFECKNGEAKGRCIGYLDHGTIIEEQYLKQEIFGQIDIDTDIISLEWLKTV